MEEESVECDRDGVDVAMENHLLVAMPGGQVERPSSEGLQIEQERVRPDQAVPELSLGDGPVAVVVEGVVQGKVEL